MVLLQARRHQGARYAEETITGPEEDMVETIATG
jgi:hypothetical protein